MPRAATKLRQSKLGKQAFKNKEENMEKMYNNIKITIPVYDALNQIYENIEVDVNSINGIMEDIYGKINIKITTPVSGYGFDNLSKSMSNVSKSMLNVVSSTPSIPNLLKKSDIQKIYENIIVKFKLTFDEMMELEHYQKMIKYLYNVLRIRDIVLIAYSNEDSDDLEKIKSFSTYSRSLYITHEDKDGSKKEFVENNDFANIQQDIANAETISTYILDTLMKNNGQ